MHTHARARGPGVSGWETKLTTNKHAIYSNIVTVLLLKTNNICLRPHVSRINRCFAAFDLEIISRGFSSLWPTQTVCAECDAADDSFY